MPPPRQALTSTTLPGAKHLVTCGSGGARAAAAGSTQFRKAVALGFRRSLPKAARSRVDAHDCHLALWFSLLALFAFHNSKHARRGALTGAGASQAEGFVQSGQSA